MVGVATVLIITVLPLLRFCRHLLLALLIGILWGGAALFWDAYQIMFDESWTSGYQQVMASIERVDDTPSYSRLLLSRIERQDGAQLSGRVELYLYGGEGNSDFMAGQTIRASLKLHPPHNKLNPGAFDYRSYCFDRHIALIGGGKGVELIHRDIPLLEQVRQRIISALPEGNESAVIRALLLADRSQIPVSVQNDFAAAGAAHLLAISGLHVGMVAGWGFMLVWWLLTRKEAWIVHLPVRKVALSTGIAIAIIYATIAGWPITAQRSVLMLAAAVVAWWLRSRSEPLNTMMAALILILLIDPASIESVSLWLSFVAVTALLLWSAQRPAEQVHLSSSPLAWISSLLWVSIIATLATLPIIADLFGRVPTYSLIANLMLVPLYSLWILPLSILAEISAALALTGVASGLFEMAAFGIHYGNQTLALFKKLPAGDLWVGDVSLFVGILYASGMGMSSLFFLKKKYIHLFACSGLTLVIYLAVVVPERYPEATEFVVWDVGQGAASTLTMPDGSVMVVDVPGRFGSRFNGGSDVAAGLRAQGLVHVDVLVVSHAQSDHAGGAIRLLEQMRYVKELWLADVPKNRRHQMTHHIEERVVSNGGSVRWLKRGDRLVFSDAQVEVLWPPQGFEDENGNNSSLVLSLVLASGHRILFTGDIETVPESRMIENEGMNSLRLNHDLMLVPHHGSRTSSSKAWIQAVSPELVITQTGKNNRYHFPHADVIDRYRSSDAKVLDTKEGAVKVRFEKSLGQGLNVEQSRPGFEGKRDAALQWWQRAL